MVVRRTIAHLKTRPHHERHALAVTLALVIMGLIFVAWVVIFFRSVTREAPLQLVTNQES